MQGWGGLEELRPLLRQYLARRCRDESEIDDVIQESMLRAARYRKSLGDPARLRAWALQIARNVLRDHVRRETRLPRAEACDSAFESLEGRERAPGNFDDDPQLCVEGEVMDEERALKHLDGALRQLRFDDQFVLSTFYAGDGSSSETARVCEIAPDLVKVRLFRARKRLLRVMLHRMSRDAGALDVGCASESGHGDGLNESAPAKRNVGARAPRKG